MTYDDRFERELDAWWDADALDDPPPPSTTALESEIETIEALQASDAPAAPTPAFAASLKVDLMMTARAMQAPARPSAVPPYFRQMKTYSLPAAGPSDPPRAAVPRPRRTFVQVAIVAALIVGMIGAVYGGALDWFANDPAPMSAVLAPKPAATPLPAAATATANYRGNSNRIGQMPGLVPVGRSPQAIWLSTVRSSSRSST